VRPKLAVVVFPVGKSNASVGERCEELLAEQLVTQPTVEVLDECVLGRLAGSEVSATSQGPSRVKS
jgi:hypothetical protein